MYESEPTRVQRGGKATNCITVWILSSGARTLSTLQQLSVIFRCRCRIGEDTEVAQS